jgi:hypothetical protein
MIFTEKLEKIFNSLEIDRHNEFAIHWFDNLLSYFQKQNNLTFDDVENKINEIKGLLHIYNPTFKTDIKLFNKLLKELNSWSEQITSLNNQMKKK